MATLDSNLIPWLITELDSRGWSQRELARRSHISQTAVSLVISGQHRPTFDFCDRIARAMGVSSEELFRRAGLLPSIPITVVEEREALALFRNLSAAMRAIALNILRALAHPGQAPQRVVGDQRAVPYTVQPESDDDYLRRQVLEEFEQLPTEWQKIALEEIQRLHRYREVKIIGGEDEPVSG